MRIFWLGMHKILVKTELPRLRELGYEVFQPRYMTDEKLHQSASRDWDEQQPSTLPREVFKKLGSYNFYFNSIVPEMADLLNTHFDAVIVTIDPCWLMEFLRVYHGRIIYRTYGHVHNMSEVLWRTNCLRLIVERRDFWYVPHAVESARHEHSWLRTRERVVPYAPKDDVLAIRDTWRIDQPKEKVIMISCPNLANAYFRDHYRYLKKHFTDPHFRFYGVQMKPVDDPQVVGTMPFEQVLHQYGKSAGFLYTYKEPAVCFLPPIEMMIAGGPVIFMEGSLLDQYFGSEAAPGRAGDEMEAREKCQRLLDGDSEFSRAIIRSQTRVRDRYLPEQVWPRFDAVFKELLGKQGAKTGRSMVYEPDPSGESGKKEKVILLGHFPRELMSFKAGGYLSGEGILRVMRLVMRAVLESTPYDFVVTCHKESLPLWNGFFSDDRFAHRISFLPVDGLISKDPERILYPLRKDDGLVSRMIHFTRRCLRYAGRRVVRGARYLHGRMVRHGLMNDATPYVNWINADASCVRVIVPHYYLFEEAPSIQKPLTLYLPDYTPHFYENRLEFGAQQEHWADVGRGIARKADRVLTNSKFSKSYLPESELGVAEEKIRVVYLPNLNAIGRDEIAAVQEASQPEINDIKSRLADKPYLFYPTQCRPNKNLPFLMDVFQNIGAEHPELRMVLTCNPAHFEDQVPSEIKSRVLFYPGTSDGALTWLYQNAKCLCFTSSMEGNFPPQIYEALVYRTPVVATELPLITERLNGFRQHLLLCKIGDLQDFLQKLGVALEQSELVLEKQERVLEEIDRQSDWLVFCEGVKGVL